MEKKLNNGKMEVSIIKAVIVFCININFSIGTTSKPPAKRSGTSLYIIIAIVALVIILCMVFYGTKWCRRKPEPKPEPEPTPKDAEEGKALIENSSNSSTESPTTPSETPNGM